MNSKCCLPVDDEERRSDFCGHSYAPTEGMAGITAEHILKTEAATLRIPGKTNSSRRRLRTVRAFSSRHSCSSRISGPNGVVFNSGIMYVVIVVAVEARSALFIPLRIS